MEQIDRANGQFHEGRDRIRISQSAPDIREIVRHELCHALDRGEGLLDAPLPAFDDYAERLWNTWSYLTYRTNRRGRRGEALAKACEFGPWGAHARAVPCPGEDLVAAEIAAFTLDHVWTGFAPNPPVPRDTSDLVVTACHADALDILTFHVTTTAVPDQIAIASDAVDDPAITTTHQVHLYTGESQAWVDDGDPAGSLDAHRPPGATFYQGASLASGVGAAHATYPLPDLGESAYRLYRSDGVDWFPTDPLCRSVERDEQVFAADDRLWFAWLDGSCVRWREML